MLVLVVFPFACLIFFLIVVVLGLLAPSKQEPFAPPQPEPKLPTEFPCEPFWASDTMDAQYFKEKEIFDKCQAMNKKAKSK